MYTAEFNLPKEFPNDGLDVFIKRLEELDISGSVVNNGEEKLLTLVSDFKLCKHQTFALGAELGMTIVQTRVEQIFGHKF